MHFFFSLDCRSERSKLDFCIPNSTTTFRTPFWRLEGRNASKAATDPSPAPANDAAWTSQNPSATSARGQTPTSLSRIPASWLETPRTLRAEGTDWMLWSQLLACMRNTMIYISDPIILETSVWSNIGIHLNSDVEILEVDVWNWDQSQSSDLVIRNCFISK